MSVRVVVNGEVIAVLRVEDTEGGEGIEEAEAEAGATEAGEEEPPNPILPDVSEMFWAALAFALMLGLLYAVKRGLPAVSRGMEARAERIRGDLEAAERARAEADRLQAEYEASLAGARAEAGRILDEARQRAEARRAEALRVLGTELAAERAQAGDELVAERDRALAQLRGDIVGLAVGAAERVLERPVDRTLASREVEAYLDGSPSPNGSRSPA